MTLNEWIAEYAENNDIELPEGIADGNTTLNFLQLNAASGGGSSLPEVTSADEGKVLAVNTSGEWTAESVMIPYDFADDVVLVTYNQLKNMMEHNKIPYYIRTREGGGITEYCLFRLSSIFYNNDGYMATFMTFSHIAGDMTTNYFGNSSPNEYLYGD